MTGCETWNSNARLTANGLRIESTYTRKVSSIRVRVRREAEQQTINGIARSRADGWHFRSDFRSLIVEAYLAEKPLSQSALEVLKDERDHYIRQYYIFRRTARCLNTAAFLWSHNCQTHRHTGSASLLKALTIAKVPVREIADKLRTTVVNVSIYQRLFFDVVQHLDDDAWITSIVFAPPTDPNDPIEFRERYWLAAAFHGERRLGQAFTPRITLSEQECEQVTSQIKSIITARAYEFVAALRTGPAAHSDFERLIKLSDMASRQTVADEGQKSYDRMLDSMDLLLDAARKAAEQPENANNLELQEIAAVLDGPAAPKTPQKFLSW